MHRTVVRTDEIARITPLPEDLKKFESLELLIYPPPSYKKEELKKRFASVFRKSKDIKVPKGIDIDELMNDMNDALL